MGMVIGNTPGTSLALSEDKIKAYKNFANKIWNITRFVLENTKDWNDTKPENISENDTKNLNELNELVADVTKDMDNYRFYLGAEKLYHYVWHTFADKIIEESKESLKNEDTKKSTQYTLRQILETSLKLLHPFMPFVTEEIWSHIDGKKLLMVTSWPK
jgi:valyl-tRNA synthetase